MFTVHHLGKSQPERVVRLCKELGLAYELVHHGEQTSISRSVPIIPRRIKYRQELTYVACDNERDSRRTDIGPITLPPIPRSAIDSAGVKIMNPSRGAPTAGYCGARNEYGKRSRH